jgi:hypothetical protein
VSIIYKLRRFFITATFCLAAWQQGWSVQSGNTAIQSPLRIEVSEKPSSIPLWLQLADKTVWPIVFLVAVFVFRKPIASLVVEFGKRGTDISNTGVAIRLPKLESQVEEQTKTLTTQQGQIAEQSEHIRNLIRFSMAWYIYKMLYEIAKAQRESGHYFYREDGSMDRNLRFLIDHGYVEEVATWPHGDEDISGKIRITQSGYDLISMRGPA